jgi:large subunit ribosomal protein L25
MENIKLEAEKRDKKENTKNLLKSGFIPGIIYGPNLKENKLVKIKASGLKKVLSKAGESTLIDLSLDGKVEGKVLLKDEQRDPLSNETSHIDLYKVDMDKEITAWIPLHFSGEAKAVKEKGGVLIRNINEVEVKCLPGDLINHIEIDISILDDFNKSIKIHDLALPKGVKMTHDTDDVIAIIAEPKAEEEPVVAPVEAEAAPAAQPKEEKEAKKE